MTDYRVEVTRQAKADVMAEYLFIVQDHPESARKWLDAIEATVKGLALMPERGRVAQESELIGSIELRDLWLKRSHRIVYWIRDDRVWVLTVRGAGMPPVPLDELRRRMRTALNQD